ncbi:MAG: hypothetical protein PHD65_01350 [Gallionella sp.]|nr:hypothetical protein [Gallionella sp.]
MNSALKICLCFYGLSVTPLSNAEELGRLFFTPEQRAQLEQDKSQSTDSGDSHRVLTVNGIVQKHGGARTVWINGIAQPAAGGDERAPESLSIAVVGHAQPVKLKVGQKLLVNPPTSEHPVSPGQ